MVSNMEKVGSIFRIKPLLFHPPPHPLLSHDIHAEHALTDQKSQVATDIGNKAVVVIDDVLKRDLWLCLSNMKVLRISNLLLDLVFTMWIEESQV